MKTVNKCVLSAMLVAFLTVSFETFAQVGIGTTSPNPSSMLDVQSTTMGMLIPRMTKSQRDNILTPAQGLQVYNTTTIHQTSLAMVFGNLLRLL